VLGIEIGEGRSNRKLKRRGEEGEEIEKERSRRLRFPESKSCTCVVLRFWVKISSSNEGF